MDKHKIERVRYKCSEANNTVTLDLEYVLIGCDQTPTHKRKLVGFDCQNKVNCKVATSHSDGSISFDWNLCPAHKEKFK